MKTIITLILSLVMLSASAQPISPSVQQPAVQIPNLTNGNNTSLQTQEQTPLANQDLKTYQQKVDQQLAELKKQNIELYNKVIQLNNQLTPLIRQTTQQQTQMPSNHQLAINTAANLVNPTKSVSTSAVNAAKHNLTSLLEVKLGGALVVFGLLMLTWLLWNNRRSNLVVATVERTEPAFNNNMDGDDEYNFMASKEAIPAKLNLARAYQEMGDLQSAIEVLEEVIKEGNSAQNQEAQRMLHKIKK